MRNRSRLRASSFPVRTPPREHRHREQRFGQNTPGRGIRNRERSHPTRRHRPRRGEGRQMLHRVPHRHHPQQQHPPGIRPGHRRFLRLVRAASPGPPRHRAGARRRLHRGVDQSQIGPHRQAAPRRHPQVLRLADQQRRPRLQPGQLGTRPQARRQAGQDARAHRRRGQATPRQHHPREEGKRHRQRRRRCQGGRAIQTTDHRPAPRPCLDRRSWCSASPASPPPWR